MTAEIDGVENHHVRTPGEMVKSIKINSSLDYGELDNTEISSIEFIANEYGRIPPDEMKGILNSLAIYVETALGEPMDFESYTD